MAIAKEAKRYRVTGGVTQEGNIVDTFIASELYRTPNGTVYLYGEVDGWFPEESIECSEIVADMVINVPVDHHIFRYFKRANLDEKSKYVIVRFSCEMFEETLTKVKELHGRRWDMARRCWLVPATEENLQELVDLDFELDRRAWYVYLDSFVASADRYTLEEIDGDAPCLYAGVECESEYCPMRGVEGVCPL